MQTRSLQWYLVYIKSFSKRRDGHLPPGNPRNQMSNTATIALSTPNNFFGRFVATLDRWLMAFAEANIRNGDIPRAGL